MPSLPLTLAGADETPPRIRDGPFTGFSTVLKALLRHRASNITATTFQETEAYSQETERNARTLQRRGARIRGGVDATNLSRWFGERLFDLIVFQFPNVGSREPIYGRNMNRVLVRRFLKSGTKHLAASGRIAITVVNSSHYDGAFDTNGAAELNGCKIPIAHPFYFADYPGHSHIKTKDDGSSALEEGDEFVTCVFRKNGEAARQWISR